MSKYKISENLYRCECGKTFTYFQSLNGHFSHCDIHCEKLGKSRNDSKIGKIHHKKGIMHGWENKTKEEIHDICIKANNILREKYKNGEIIPSFLGKHHSPETKQKLREIAIKRVGYSANFSKKACDFIDNLNKEKGWNLQHALNGGEKIVKGYYLDGYDKGLNIVFEYDEPSHYIDVENNILIAKDQERQDIIIETLGCKFFRYNEKKNELYEAKIEDNFYLYIEDAIKDNKIDYTSRTTIKNSLKEIGLSIKRFDLYLEKHQEIKEDLRIKLLKKKEEERNEKLKEKKERLQKLKEEKSKKHEILILKRKKLNKENIEICNEVNNFIQNKKINLSSWNRIKQILLLLEEKIGIISPKKLKIALKTNKELYNQIYNREFLGSQNQIWIHNPETNETIRIKTQEIKKYPNWIRGRK